jgi:hypothetical protein
MEVVLGAVRRHHVGDRDGVADPEEEARPEGVLAGRRDVGVGVGTPARGRWRRSRRRGSWPRRTGTVGSRHSDGGNVESPKQRPRANAGPVDERKDTKPVREAAEKSLPRRRSRPVRNAVPLVVSAGSYVE